MTAPRFLYTWFVVVFRSIVTSIGIPGNLIILIVYWNENVLGSAQIFIKAIAICDCFACLILPLEVYYWLYEFDFHSDILCKVFYTWESIGWYFSTCLTAAIAWDRYLAVCKPHNGRWSRKKAVKVCHLCLLIALLVNILVPFVSGTILSEVVVDSNITIHNLTICYQYGEDVGSVLFVLTTVPQYSCFLFAFVVVIYLYVRLWKNMKTRQSVLSASNVASVSYVNGPSTSRLQTLRRSPATDETQRVSGLQVPSPSYTSPSYAGRKQPDETQSMLGSPRVPYHFGNQVLGTKDTNSSSDAATPSSSSHTTTTTFITCDVPIPGGLRVDSENCQSGHNKLGSCWATKSRSRASVVQQRPRLMSRLSQMLFLVTVFFVLTWSMTLIMYMFSTTSLGISRDSFGYAVIAVLRLTGLLNHAVNPFLYSFINSKFRTECSGLFQRLIRRIRT